MYACWLRAIEKINQSEASVIVCIVFKIKSHDCRQSSLAMAYYLRVAGSTNDSSRKMKAANTTSSEGQIKHLCLDSRGVDITSSFVLTNIDFTRQIKVV